jgi:polyhydroxyalkanoate synthesis regulator phasin
VAEKTVKVPEFLREPLEAAQARLGVLEEESQRMLKELMQKGKAGRREIVEMVEKLSKQDWTVDELKVRLGKLKHQGAELAAEWRDRARHEALDRLVEMHAKAIAFLGVASREQVSELSRELERLSRKLEKGKKVARKPARKPTEA